MTRLLLLLSAVLGTAACVHEAIPDPLPGRLGVPVELVLPALDGDVVDLGALRGRAVVVHLTASWSLAGQADLDELRRARAQDRDVALVEVALDPEGRKLARPWADAVGIDWPVALVSPALASGQTTLGAVRVSPTTFVLDFAGKITWRHVGRLPRGELARVVHALYALPDRP